MAANAPNYTGVYLSGTIEYQYEILMQLTETIFHDFNRGSVANTSMPDDMKDRLFGNTPTNQHIRSLIRKPPGERMPPSEEVGLAEYAGTLHRLARNQGRWPFESVIALPQNQALRDGAISFFNAEMACDLVKAVKPPPGAFDWKFITQRANAILQTGVENPPGIIRHPGTLDPAIRAQLTTLVAGINGGQIAPGLNTAAMVGILEPVMEQARQHMLGLVSVLKFDMQLPPDNQVVKLQNIPVTTRGTMKSMPALQSFWAFEMAADGVLNGRSAGDFIKSMTGSGIEAGRNFGQMAEELCTYHLDAVTHTYDTFERFFLNPLKIAFAEQTEAHKLELAEFIMSGANTKLAIVARQALSLIGYQVTKEGVLKETPERERDKELREAAQKLRAVGLRAINIGHTLNTLDIELGHGGAKPQRTSDSPDPPS